MNINSVDLNLFLVFRAVYATRSVTLAGKQLNVTQSAVSNALKRLRARFDDPLFVRAPTGMEPTPLAIQLIVPVEEGLIKFTQAIDQVRRFQPATSERLFRIAMNDVGQLIMMPRLFRAVRHVAPNVRLETVEVTSGDHARQMVLDGEIDLVVGSWSAMGTGFFQQHLVNDGFIAMMALDHPYQGEQLSLEQYLAAQHVTYRPSGGSDDALQTRLGATGLLTRRNVVLKVAHSLGLSSIVASSQLLLTLPQQLGEAMVQTRNDLRLARLPIKIEPFPIRTQLN